MNILEKFEKINKIEFKDLNFKVINKFDKKEYNKVYYIENREDLRKRAINNMIENKKYIKDYYIENKEKIREQQKKYYNGLSD